MPKGRGSKRLRGRARRGQSGVERWLEAMKSEPRVAVMCDQCGCVEWVPERMWDGYEFWCPNCDLDDGEDAAQEALRGP